MYNQSSLGIALKNALEEMKDEESTLPEELENWSFDLFHQHMNVMMENRTKQTQTEISVWIIIF